MLRGQVAQNWGPEQGWMEAGLGLVGAHGCGRGGRRGSHGGRRWAWGVTFKIQDQKASWKLQPCHSFSSFYHRSACRRCFYFIYSPLFPAPSPGCYSTWRARSALLAHQTRVISVQNSQAATAPAHPACGAPGTPQLQVLGCSITPATPPKPSTGVEMGQGEPGASLYRGLCSSGAISSLSLSLAE